MKRLAGFSALALLISGTSGCGWLWGDDGYFRDRSADYLNARQTAPMQVPAGTQARALDPLLPVPAAVASSTANPENFEVPRPQPLQVTEAQSAFSLQKSGDSRWLVAQRAPSEVWPVAQAYLTNSGFRIASEQPQLGEFVTDWQHSSELAPSMGRRVASLLQDKDNQARVRVRIEPGVMRGTSEVFVVAVEREQGSSANVAFPARSANAALESSLLDGLLSDLSSSAVHGSVSLLAARNYDAPSRVSVSQDGAGNAQLNLSTDFDRAWSSVGRALEMANIRVDDLNRSSGIYYINLAEGAKQVEDERGFFSRVFSRSDSQAEIDARAERYQLRVSNAANGVVQVSVEKDSNTAAPQDVAQRVLNLIRDNLG